MNRHPGYAFVLLFAALNLSFFTSQARGAHPATNASHARPNSSGQSGNVGLGVMLGEPTGFSAKFWLSKVNAIDAGVSYSFGNFLLVMGDYLWHFHGVFAKGGEVARDFIPYLGGGLALFVDTSSSFSRRNDASLFRTSNSGNIGLGFRFPLGVEYLAHQLPLGVFLEIAPGLGVVPETFGFVQGDIGVRFYL